jgi:hypothetical protein
MPKRVHDLVNKLLQKKDFYPDKFQEEREEIAWGIAQKQLKHKKSQTVENLLRAAEYLDSLGLYREADVISESLKS